MAPRVVSIDAGAPDEGVLAEAAEVLRRGGLVAFPTETVYGLGACALDRRALAAVFRAKGRPTTHALIAHVTSEAAARSLAARWPDAASRLAAAFWPGPLTLVVPRGPSVPEELTGGGATVALRAPSHPVARALIATFGQPVAAPSANRYQSLSPTRAEHVVRSLGDAVDLVLDGGPCPAGIESTVVDVCEDPPRVLRPGALFVDALAQVVPVLGSSVLGSPAPGDARRSPGLDLRHYAPQAELRVVAERSAARAVAEAEARGGRTVVLLLRGEADEAFADGVCAVRALPPDPEGYGRELFAALHAIDHDGASLVVAEAVPDGPRWWAIRDRLARAAHRAAR